MWVTGFGGAYFASMNYWRYLLPGWLVGLGLLAGHYKAVPAAPR